MKRSILARILYFDQKLRDKSYPSVRAMSRELEVCERTIARDIDYMRGTLGAPLMFNHSMQGYYYSESWTLPEAVIALGEGEKRVESILAAMKALSPNERAKICNSLGFFRIRTDNPTGTDEPMQDADDSTTSTEEATQGASPANQLPPASTPGTGSPRAGSNPPTGLRPVGFHPAIVRIAPAAAVPTLS